MRSIRKENPAVASKEKATGTQAWLIREMTKESLSAGDQSRILQKTDGDKVLERTVLEYLKMNPGASTQDVLLFLSRQEATTKRNKSDPDMGRKILNIIVFAMIGLILIAVMGK